MNAPSKRICPLGAWPVTDPAPRRGPAPKPSDPGGAEAFEAWFFEAMVALTLTDPRKRETPNPRKRESPDPRRRESPDPRERETSAD